jgi:hypothetical protein
MQEIEMKNEIDTGEIAKIDKSTPNKVQVQVREIADNGEVVEKTGWKSIIVKKWYQSKTMIFNLGVAAITGVGSLLSDESFKAMMGDFFAYVLTFITIANVYLRTITNSPVER